MNCITKRLLDGGSGNPQPAYQFKMVERRMKLQETQKPLDAAQRCSVFVFSLAEISALKSS